MSGIHVKALAIVTGYDPNTDEQRVISDALRVELGNEEVPLVDFVRRHSGETFRPTFALAVFNDGVIACLDCIGERTMENRASAAGAGFYE